MPRTVTTQVFQFDELTDSAKEKARQWWRDAEASSGDTYFAEYITDMAKDAADILGISLAHKNPWNWIGFSSQGDGAAFRGVYSYAKGAAKAIRKEFPKATALHRIADDLQEAQRKAFYRLTADCTTDGWNNQRVSVDSSGDVSPDAALCNAVEGALESFAHWFYRALESEYDYTMADEQVDESIRCNEYEFDEDGNRA